MIRAFISALIVAGSLWPSPGYSETFRQRVDAMPANSWLLADGTMAPRVADRSRLTDSKATTITPRPVMATSPVWRPYSGLVAAPWGVIEFGGGHSGHPGNDVDVYRLAENLWRTDGPPELPEPTSDDSRRMRSGGSSLLTVTPAGRPYTEHTYQTVVYDGRRDRLLSMVASGLWEYPMATATWRRLATTWYPQWQLGNGLVLLDPTKDELVVFIRSSKAGAKRGVYRAAIGSLETAPHPWRWIEEVSASFFQGTNIYGAVNAERREAYVLSWSGTVRTLRRYNLDATGPGGFTDLPLDPVMTAAGEPLFDYDTVAKRLVFMDQKSLALMTFDPATHAWAALPRASGPSGGKIGGKRRFVFVADPGVFVYGYPISLYCRDVLPASGCGGDTQTWIYRLTSTAAIGRQSMASLLGGPMIGHTTATTSSVWVRTTTEAVVTVAVSLLPDLSAPVLSVPVPTLGINDYAAVVPLAGLLPGTRYYYDVLVDDAPTLQEPFPSFRAFPVEGLPARVRIAVGACTKFQVDADQLLWDAIRAQAPDAIALLGDNVYADNAISDAQYAALVTTPGLDLGGNIVYLKHGPQGWSRNLPTTTLGDRVFYRIQQSLPRMRDALTGIPTYAIWDDHEAPGGEGGGGSVSWTRRNEARRVFMENWANPSYGGTPPNTGIWTSFRIGDVEVFLLDGRTCRKKPNNPANRVLFCPEEEAWVQAALLASTAKWKLLMIGSPWNNQPKNGVPLTSANYYDVFGDTLATYKLQRDAFLEWLLANEIPGVVLVSGDRHRADVTQVWPWPLTPAAPAGRTFYDFTNANIASGTMDSLTVGVDGLVWSFSGRVFGLLDIDTTVTPATLAYEVWGGATPNDPVLLQARVVLQLPDAPAFLPVLVP